MPSLSPQVHAQVHGNQTLVMGKDRVFAFDSVYGPEAGQEGIYDEWVAPLVDALFSGYNATVLAYGQTGTGKTFTMGSGDNTGKMAAELGNHLREVQQSGPRGGVGDRKKALPIRKNIHEKL